MGGLGSLSLGSGNLLLLLDAQMARLGGGWGSSSLDVRRSNGRRHYGDYCWLFFFFVERLWTSDFSEES